MPAVRTVLGDVPAAELGVCDAHDHLFFRSAQLAGQELDDAHAAVSGGGGPACSPGCPEPPEWP